MKAVNLAAVSTLILAAACSSSPTRKTSAEQQGQAGNGPTQPSPNDPGAQPDDPGGEEPTTDAGQGPGDDAGAPVDAGSGDAGGSADAVDGGGAADCVFNAGTGGAHPSGWRPVASPSSIGQSATAPQATARWTGHELLVFGGGMSASYQPATDTWKALPDAPITMRAGAIVELAGKSKLVVYGGGYPGNIYANDGAIFDVCTATWTKIPAAPISGRDFTAHAYATTSGELVVWGGNRSSVPSSDASAGAGGGEKEDGAAYDLATGTWRVIANARTQLAPTGDFFTAFYGSAWTGSTMLVYGGGPNHGGAPTTNAALEYDPVADKWSWLASPAVQGRQFTGGQAEAAMGTSGVTFFQGNAVRLPLWRPGDGASYDFATRTWTAIPAPDVAALPDPVRDNSGFAWIGGRMYLWGGFGTDATTDASGASFDPLTKTWSAMPTGGPVRSTYDNVYATALDGEALFWGDQLAIFRP